MCGSWDGWSFKIQKRCCVGCWSTIIQLSTERGGLIWTRLQFYDQVLFDNTGRRGAVNE